jgi:hypothetical protein
MWSLSSSGFEGTRSRSSSCVALLVHELGAQDRRRVPLFLFLSRALKIVVVRCSSYSLSRVLKIVATRHCEL